ncbi:NTP transferase domain-containing protein [Jatrophihabitans sp. GAS493]|uniref:nucleotidyltransferase family protein n=1 Tax=Jatrophihabitans sp. GAS493 TaxID=1907575 RepID=UPI000BB8C26A|nr:nucleotidyltransferase family protein [Jatrophihabitans sp. GAS493]
MPTTGIVLAAGAGTRLGGPKADLLLGGERLLDRAVRALADGGCDSVLVVLREGAAPPAGNGVRVVTNPDPGRGLASSLRLALAAADGDRVLSMVVDRPGISADAVARVHGVAGPIVVASFDGVRAHPVAIMREHWAEVAELADGDDGARTFMRRHPELVTEVACVGDPADIDTPEDLARWRQLIGD